jgi:PIN domain nuclease of toxin-antitoxin system
MNLLLDTHAFIWFLNGDEQLSSTLKNLITDTSNKCFLSIASIWEIAVKSSLNKLKLQGSFDQIAGFINELMLNYCLLLSRIFKASWRCVQYGQTIFTTT